MAKGNQLDDKWKPKDTSRYGGGVATPPVEEGDTVGNYKNQNQIDYYQNRESKGDDKTPSYGDTLRPPMQQSTHPEHRMPEHEHDGTVLK